jgi:hypothetical protein
MRSDTPCQFRYAIWRVLLVLWTVLLVGALINAGKSDHPLLWKNVWPVLELFGLWLLYLFICWKARQRALEEKKAMLALTNRPGPRKQSFLWQAVLILLPVALMASFGFWAILRERNAVEQQARERAKEILQALPAEFGRIAANRLTQFEVPKGGWFQYLQWGIAAWPGNKTRQQFLADTNEAQILTNELLEFRSVFPDWPAGPVALVDFSLDAKPFSTDELLARVRALLRRMERKSRRPLKFKLGDVEIDLARQTAVRGKKPVHLTAKEFAMLRLMAEAEGQPVTRERFLDVVWGYTAFPTTLTVDNHIASLRVKLERNPNDPRWVKTVHGVGYKLEL